MKKLLLLWFIIGVILFVSCQAKTNETPNDTSIQHTKTPSLQTTAPKTLESTIQTEEPTQTPTAQITSTPTGFIPDENTYGPYIFGSYKFYFYIESLGLGSKIALIDSESGKTVFSDYNKGMYNLELTLLTASIIDLNFDGIPDFSYVKDKNDTRHCWLANGSIDENGDISITSYTYHPTLSAIPHLTRCFESNSIYGLDFSGTSAVFEYKYNTTSSVLSKNTELTNIFSWNIDKIASALVGPGASVTVSDDVTIRGSLCKTYTVGGYITIANDKYGHYFIKDMPGDGFYRLSLNPNGNWSKSEKVTLGTDIMFE